MNLIIYGDVIVMTELIAMKLMIDYITKVKSKVMEIVIITMIHIIEINFKIISNRIHYVQN